METVVVVVHMIAAIAIVGLVLLQQGKGADAGAAFGSGSSQTVFGASGSGNFLSRSTGVAATVFFITSLTLAIYAKQATAPGVINSPIVNPALLNQSAPVTDIPQVEVPASDTTDVPQVEEEPAN